MKTLTRTVRLAVGVAAMLAIMAPVAQARPLDSHGPITASQRATDLIMPQSTPEPITASQRATDLIMPSGTDIVHVIPVQTTDQGFDWIAAAVGAGSALAIMLVAAVVVTGRGRRRVAVSG